KSASNLSGRSVFGSAPHASNVVSNRASCDAIAYARSGTFFPSGVGGAACFASSSRTRSALPELSASCKTRRVLGVHAGRSGRRLRMRPVIFALFASIERARIRAALTEIGHKFQEKLERVFLMSGDSVIERGATAASADVDPGHIADQFAQHVDLALHRGSHERRETGFIGKIGASAGVQ